MPSWCRWHGGKSPVLVIAPHGGVCSADLLLRPVKGNDLHTVDVADELARRLDASLIVNTAHDRNELDLNRVRDVHRHAPWYLDLIEALLDGILARHAEAELVFVHGWHVIQSLCDIGIGVALEDADLATAHADRLTVRPGYVRERLEPFRAGCAEAGIVASYGERWPAAHPNNVMQLFRRTSKRERSARIDEWASQGRLNAVQLELGAPLRWPGPQRSAFVEVAAAAFGGTASISPRCAESACRESVAPCTPSSLLVRAFDADGCPHGIGILAGLARLPGGDLGARLLVFPGGQRMAIFTGHGRDRGVLAVPGLALSGDASEFTLRFTGQLLLVDDGARYFQDERVQVAARLVDGHAELVFRGASSGIGALEGRIEIDGHGWTMATGGFVDASPRARRSDRILACFGASLSLVADIDWDAGEAAVERVTPDGSENLGRARIEPSRAGLAAHDGFALAFDTGPALRCIPATRVTVLRPAERGAHRRVTLGTARFDWGASGRGAGFYEWSLPH